VALCNHFKQPVDKQIFFPGFDQTIKIFTDVIWWVGKDQIDTFGGDLFKFGKRITVNNGLSLITKPGRFTSCSHGHSLCDTYKKGASPCRVAPF